MAVRRLASEQPDTFALTAENVAWAEAKIRDYPDGRQASAVIPILWKAQEQHGGWLPEPAIRLVADMLQMPYIRAFEIATFYTMFQLQPIGTVAHIGVCGTTPCMLRGADELVAVCRSRIAPKPFERSADGRFSWEEVECAGACVNAPMVQIGADTYEDLTVESFNALLDTLASGGTPKVGPQSSRHGSEPISGLTTLTSPRRHDHPEAAEAPGDATPDANVDPSSPAAGGESAGRPSGSDRSEVEATRVAGTEASGRSEVAPEPQTSGQTGTPDEAPQQKSAFERDEPDDRPVANADDAARSAAASDADPGPAAASRTAAADTVEVRDQDEPVDRTVADRAAPGGDYAEPPAGTGSVADGDAPHAKPDGSGEIGTDVEHPVTAAAVASGDDPAAERMVAKHDDRPTTDDKDGDAAGPAGRAGDAADAADPAREASDASGETAGPAGRIDEVATTADLAREAPDASGGRAGPPDRIDEAVTTADRVGESGEPDRSDDSGDKAENSIEAPTDPDSTTIEGPTRSVSDAEHGSVSAATGGKLKGDTSTVTAATESSASGEASDRSEEVGGASDRVREDAGTTGSVAEAAGASESAKETAGAPGSAGETAGASGSEEETAGATGSAEEVADASRSAEEVADASRSADEIVGASGSGEEVADASRSAEEIAGASGSGEEVADASRSAEETAGATGSAEEVADASRSADKITGASGRGEEVADPSRSADDVADASGSGAAVASTATPDGLAADPDFTDVADGSGPGNADGVDEVDSAAADMPDAPNAAAAQRADEAGRRPAALDVVHVGEPDDLQRISGVGPVIRKTLNALGIHAYAQIAAWDQPNKDWVSTYLAFKGRIDREQWVEQARKLSAEKQTTETSQ